MSTEFEQPSHQLCDGTIVLVARHRIAERDRAELLDYLRGRLNGHRVVVTEECAIACLPEPLASQLTAALGVGS